MKPPVVLIVCNALDDETRLERLIDTDSPAASRKVFQMCQALRLAGVRPYVLSLGRGRASGRLKMLPAKVCRINGIPTIYAPFSHLPLVSEVLSLVGLVRPIARLASRPRRAVIFYNRMVAYLPSLFSASMANYRCFLDLEDGEVIQGKSSLSLRGALSRLTAALFDRFCRDGALLACSALRMMTRVRPTVCYYGTAVSDALTTRWRGPVVSCLMSGTLAPDTGAPMLVDAIRTMRRQAPDWCSRLRFEITGKGSSLADFEALAREPGFPEVIVHGRTTDARYLEVLRGCDVGLALKPIDGALADTTFPSKVIEFAGAGLLVLSTDISDVRRLLGDGARYLTRNDPLQLVERLAEVVDDLQAARECALRGQSAAVSHCAPGEAGYALRSFIFGGGS